MQNSLSPLLPSTRRSGLRGRLGLCGAAAGLVLVLAACNGSSAAAVKVGAATPASSTTIAATSDPASTAAPASSTAPAAAGNAAAGGTNPNAAALTAYRTCLTDHGVTLPTRPTTATVAGAAPATTVAGQGRGANGGFAGGIQAIMADPANKTAVDACASLVPAGGFGQGGQGRAPNPARAAARQAYYSCLSDNGVTVPTTVAGGPPVSIDQTAPAFAAANAKCQALLPARTPNSSSSTTVAG